MIALRLVVALIWSTCVSLCAARHYARAVSEISNFQQSLRSTKDTINKYNGGLLSALPVSGALFKMHRTLKDTRQAFSDMPELPADRADELHELMLQDVSPMIVDTTEAIVSKVCCNDQCMQAE